MGQLFWKILYLQQVFSKYLKNNFLFFSWLNIFNKLTKSYGKVKIPPVTLARKTYIRPSVEQLYAAINTSITIIVGRNPFERLVSAYRDKILNAYSRSEHDVLGRVKKTENNFPKFIFNSILVKNM
jgi:hypothetical protein